MKKLQKSQAIVHAAGRELSIKDAMMLRKCHGIVGRSIYPDSMLLAYNDGITTTILAIRETSGLNKCRYLLLDNNYRYYVAMSTGTANTHDMITSEMGKAPREKYSIIRPDACGGFLRISEYGIVGEGTSTFGQGPNEGAEVMFTGLIRVVAREAIAFAKENGYAQIAKVIRSISRPKPT